MSKKVTLSTLAVALLTLGAHSLYTSLLFDTQDTLPNSSLSLITEPDQTMSSIIDQIIHATKSVDLVMYELQDPAIEQDLADDQSRGVNVRVLLNGGYYGKSDTPNKNESAYKFLQSHNIAVRWTPSQFALTHQKTLIVDDATATVMTFNMSPQYYAADRDFGVVDADVSDVAQIENTFDADWSNPSVIPALSRNPETKPVDSVQPKPE